MKKTSFAKVAGGLALLAVSSMAMASVVDTKHNLGATNIAASNHTSNTTEICVFCHTPHGGDQTATAPIWNRGTGSNGTTAEAAYNRFSSLGRLTFDAKEAPVGSVSAACLSCHDGTQAMDAVINAPGSDSIPFNTTNAALIGNGSQIAGGPSGGWSQGQRMGDGSFAPADGAWTTTMGAARLGDLVYLGTDLRNDHPISMQYGGGGISTTLPTGKTIDPDFAQVKGTTNGINGSVVGAGHAGGLYNPNGTIGAGSPTNAGAGNTTSTNMDGVLIGVNGSGTGAIVHVAAAGGPGGQERWYVETDAGVTGGYTSQDFPLYSRTDVTGTSLIAGVPTANSGILQPTVECGTCHDPHSGNSTFLRLQGGNRGSQVCLTCHAK